MADTAKVILIEGNPKKPESAEHIIKFPGGSIAVCRTTNNEYWAHIEVYQDNIISDTHRESINGKIIKSRLDYNTPHGVIKEITDLKDLSHIAVRIRTKGD